MAKKKEQIDIGYMDLPADYSSFSDDEKKKICDNLIDLLFLTIDQSLPKEINRLTFVQKVFESSLITNEEDENYEVCQVILHCLEKLKEK